MYSGFSKTDGSIIGDLSATPGYTATFSEAAAEVAIKHIVDDVDMQSAADDDTAAAAELQLQLQLRLGEACETTSAEESLMCSDDDGNVFSLSAHISPQSGELLWGALHTNMEILQRTVGMSQMTSMLRDNRRNALYAAAIEASIRNFIRCNHRAPVVLDIGTGAGLLAMLCVQCGAEFVFAVEMFETMAAIAQQVVQRNGMEDKICVICAKSTDIEALPGAMQADLLVSELLDSALLGESCVPSHLDAVTRLLSAYSSATDAAIATTDDAEQQPNTYSSSSDNSSSSSAHCHTRLSDRVVPHSGRVYGALIESNEVQRMQSVAAIQLGGHSTVAINNNSNSNTNSSSGSEYGNSDLLFNPYRDEAAAAEICQGGSSSTLIPVHAERLQERNELRLLSSNAPLLNIEFFHTHQSSSKAGFFSASHSSNDCEMHSYENDVDFGTVDTDMFPTSGNGDSCSGGGSYNNNKTSTHCPAGCYDTDILVMVDGTLHGVLLYWDLFLLSPELDPTRSCTYSTAPNNNNSNDNNNDNNNNSSSNNKSNNNSSNDWQDHWQQVVCPLPAAIAVAAGDVVRVTAAHNGVQIVLSAEKLPPPYHNAATSVVQPRQQQQLLQMRRCTNDALVVEKLSRECNCGWHLLCGASRFLAMSDQRHSYCWQQAIQELLSQQQQEQQQQQHGVVLDCSDGSLLAIQAAIRVRNMKGIGKCADWKIVSKESKFFSRFFFSQLASANDLAEVLMIWDGQDYTDIGDYFSAEQEEGEKEGEYGNMGSHQSMQPEQEEEIDSWTVSADGSSVNRFGMGSVRLLMSECFYYQLYSLPTWQAVAFYYQRHALAKLGLLHQHCVIAPQRAYIMAAALQLEGLERSHGLVGRVMGLDHRALDEQQLNWHQHLYPYKIADYKKRMLTAPTCIYTLDYTTNHYYPFMDADCSSPPQQQQQQHQQQLDTLLSTRPQQRMQDSSEALLLPVVQAGRCDCVVLWVDYQLTSSIVERALSSSGSSDESEFPSYLATSVKYFAQSVEVREGDAVASVAKFAFGDKEVQLSFEVQESPQQKRRRM